MVHRKGDGAVPLLVKEGIEGSLTLMKPTNDAPVSASQVIDFVNDVHYDDIYGKRTA
jgi:hypothetical protein